MLNTFDELKPLLLKTKEIFEWEIDDEEEIRAWYGDRCFCPITACRFINDNKIFAIHEWSGAAKNLVDLNLASNIVGAADFDLDDPIREWLVKNLL